MMPAARRVRDLRRPEGTTVNLLWSALVTLGASAIAIAGILLVRRRAPDGGYFNDGDRAAGVFGVLATGYAVLLGFVVFLAFTRYDLARAGAEAEALTLIQQWETAQLFPEEHREDLTGQLTCYGRSVVYQEWPRLGGDEAPSISPWGIELFRTIETIEPETSSEQSAYDAWLALTSAREEARRDRVHGAEGVIPASVWFVLLFSAAIVFGFMLFFADSGERAVVQALLIGTVTAVVVMTLLVLRVLDAPYGGGVSSLRPVAMERALTVIEDASAALDLTGSIPCDATGVALER
jgi:hypothetical protein